jgi:hypothetical protein
LRNFYLEFSLFLSLIKNFSPRTSRVAVKSKLKRVYLRAADSRHEEALKAYGLPEVTQVQEEVRAVAEVLTGARSPLGCGAARAPSRSAPRPAPRVVRHFPHDSHQGCDAFRHVLPEYVLADCVDRIWQVILL